MSRLGHVTRQVLFCLNTLRLGITLRANTGETGDTHLGSIERVFLREVACYD